MPKNLVKKKVFKSKNGINKCCWKFSPDSKNIYIVGFWSAHFLRLLGGEGGGGRVQISCSRKIPNVLIHIGLRLTNWAHVSSTGSYLTCKIISHMKVQKALLLQFT